MGGGEEHDVEDASHLFHAGFGQATGGGAHVTRVRVNVHLCVPIYGALNKSDLVRGNVGFGLLRV